MLRAGRSTAALALALVGWTAAAVGPAHADGASGGTGGGGGTVTPCQNDWICSIATDPGSGGSTSNPGTGGGGSGGSGGSNTCAYQGKQEPCYIGGVGYLNESDGCYYELAAPQPPAGDIAWGGHQPGDGAVYTRACPDQAGTGQTDVWLANPPAAAQPVITPQQLLQRMLTALKLPQVAVRTAPTGPALVGQSIWVWADRANGNFPDAANPLTVPAATAGAITVTAKVWVSHITWDMGDGGTASPCNGPGTPYDPSQGAKPSPDCGYQYTKPSQPNQPYKINATVTWTVSWQVNGGATQTFDLPPRTGPAGTLQVNELQVLN